jgi:predicted Zn-dependent protease
VLIGLSVLTLSGLIVGGAYYRTQNSSARTERPRAVPTLPETERAVRKFLLLHDLEEAKNALADLELFPGIKGHSSLPLSQALLKREFLFDTDGALMSLQTARSLAQDERAKAEIDNLLAVYGFDRDGPESISTLQRLVRENPSEPVFRYNLALAQLRSGQAQQAASQMNTLVGNLKAESELLEDAAVLLGWAREKAASPADPQAEAAYLKAIERNESSPKGRLGLALYRLRKRGSRAAEAEFRAFLDSAPELDSPSRVVNFRLMRDSDFYSYARAQIRELNIPGGPVGSKPSPLIMAVDAVLSCLQSRTGEAGKMIDVALSAAPGDVHLLKAMAYHRWKEGRFADVIELLKGVNREPKSYAIPLMLGKAFAKMGRLKEARQQFELMTRNIPDHSDGWAHFGETLLAQKRLEDAKRNLEAALQRDPYDLTALRGLSRLGLDEALLAKSEEYLPL